MEMKHIHGMEIMWGGLVWEVDGALGNNTGNQDKR